MKIPPWFTPFFVWFICAATFLHVIRFVYLYGVDLPYWDEWEGTVPRMSGLYPVTWSWFWSPWNEHRIVLPRALSLAVLELSELNFRSVMFFNVLLLGASCLLLLLAIGRIRSGSVGYRWSVTDAVFPLLLLNTGHWENLTWAFQTQYFVGVFWIALLLFVASTRKSMTSTGRLSRSYLLCLSLLLIALVLTGGNGIVYAPLGGVYLVAIGVATLRGSGDKTGGWFSVGAGLAVAALILLYFRGLNPPAPTGGSLVTLRTIARTSLNYLSIGFGRGIHPVLENNRSLRITTVCAAVGLSAGISLLSMSRLPYWKRITLAGGLFFVSIAGGWTLARIPSPTPNEFFTIALVPTFVGVTCVAAVTALRQPSIPTETRRQILWAMVVVGGALLSAIAVGKGRAVMGTGAGLIPRYGILSAQVLIGLYFVAVAAKRDSFPFRFIPVVLFALTVTLFPANWEDGKIMGESRRRMMTQFREYANAGAPLPVLVALSNGVNPNEESAVLGIAALRRRGYKLFAHTPDASGLRRIVLSGQSLGLPRPLIIDPQTRRLRIALPTETTVDPVNAIVVRYDDYVALGAPGNYRVVALRRTATGFVEQGEAAEIPYPGFGSLLLSPNGRADAIEIRSMPDGGGFGPANLSITQISLFRSIRTTPLN